MCYVSHCTANRRVFNADMRLAMLSVGSWRNSGNEYQTTGPTTESVRQRKLAVMVSWQDQLMTVGWPQGLHWQLETSDVHMQGVAVTQTRAKNSLTSIWRPVYVQVRSSADIYTSMAVGSKSNWPVNFAVKSIAVKDGQWQRNTTENTCNQHATSVFEQRQIHRKTSHRRKSTVDSKKLVI